MTRAERRAAINADLTVLAQELARETIDLSNKAAFSAITKLWAERCRHRRSWNLGKQVVWDYRRRFLFEREASP